MLVVVGLIALLTGILIPAVSTVKKIAKEAKQKAQFTAIELGLEAYRNDFGEYPPSDQYSWWEDDVSKSLKNSAGALKLAEAMLGRDLMGVHPDTGFRVDGTNRRSYVVGATTHTPTSYDLYNRANSVDMDKRKGRYVEMDVANPFRFGETTAHFGAFNMTGVGSISQAADCYLLGDVFGKGPEVVQPDDKSVTSDGKRVRSGRPILYYRANPASKFVTSGSDSAYAYDDNSLLLGAIETNDRNRMGTPTNFWNPLLGPGTFVNHVMDPRASITTGTTTSYVPYRPDSYILVSAGADGFYGTSDDVRNFGRRPGRRAGIPKRGSRCSRGMTLIEILVAVAVILILSGVVISLTRRVDNQAKERAVRNVFSLLKGALTEYYDANDTFPLQPNPTVTTADAMTHMTDMYDRISLPCQRRAKSSGASIRPSRMVPTQTTLWECTIRGVSPSTIGTGAARMGRTRMPSRY